MENLHRLFTTAGIAQFGFTLEQFKRNPNSVLRQCGQPSAPDCIANGFKPLLPAQAMVAKQLQGQWEHDALAAKVANVPRKRLHSNTAILQPAT